MVKSTVNSKEQCLQLTVRFRTNALVRYERHVPESTCSSSLNWTIIEVTLRIQDTGTYKSRSNLWFVHQSIRVQYWFARQTCSDHFPMKPIQIQPLKFNYPHALKRSNHARIKEQSGFFRERHSSGSFPGVFQLFCFLRDSIKGELMKFWNAREWKCVKSIFSLATIFVPISCNFISHEIRGLKWRTGSTFHMT